MFSRGNFLLNYQNSLIVTVATIALTLVLGTLAAFGHHASIEVRIAAAARRLLHRSASCCRSGSAPCRSCKTMIAWGIMDTLAALILVYTAMSCRSPSR